MYTKMASTTIYFHLEDTRMPERCRGSKFAWYMKYTVNSIAQMVARLEKNQTLKYSKLRKVRNYLGKNKCCKETNCSELETIHWSKQSHHAPKSNVP